MKTTQWIFTLLLPALLVLGGCSKPAPPPPTVQGVTVDLPKLREAFASANADCQSAISEVAEGFRYGEYAKSLTALAKLDQAPGVTEAQKKVVAELTDQFKQLANKSSPRPQ